MKEISVNEALRIGKRKAGMLFILPFYSTLISSCIVVLVLNLSPLYILIAVVAGLFMAYYFSTKYLYQWQVWAFEEVRNRHELKLKAEKWGLIPGWEQKLFPPSSRERMMLERLNEKFNQPDVIEDNSHIPEVFEIYYSKIYNRFQFIGWSLTFIGLSYGITQLFLHHQIQGERMMQIVLGGFWLCSLFFSIENFIQLRTTKPVITLSPDGIQFKRRQFQKADIKDIEITEGKDKMLKVRFHATKLAYPIEINDLDIHIDALQDIAEVFVKRWR